MILKSIEMSNFRNYEREEFHFHEGTNVLYGDNAQGKTNVLEAIYLGGTTKSHKGSKDSDMIMKGKDEAHIRYYVEKKQCTYKIEIHMRRGKTKGIAIDGLPIGSSKELMGLSHIIFFSPEDLGIIKDGPEQRRRFMDMELCQLDKAYLYYLTQYKKILKQRNALLKQIQKNSELKDTLMNHYGKRDHDDLVNAMQKKKAENMMEFLTKNHKELSCLEESKIVEPLTSLIRITTERTRPDNGERTN